MRTMLSKLLCAYDADMGIVCDFMTCTCQATRTLSLHRIDHCKSSENGANAALLMCGRHATEMVQHAARHVHELKTAAELAGIECGCAGCGLKIEDLQSVVTLGWVGYRL